MTGARFLGSFPRADRPLDPPLPEVAFVGRSNVGKSSLLNALVGSRVAKISGTPGKTRMMNVYGVSGAWCVVRGTASPVTHAPRTTHHALYFLDLPGYGYARASKGDLRAFQGLVRHALGRPRLAGVVWLLDIRHEPSTGDLAMQDLLAERETRVLAALTKGDKPSRELARDRAQKLRAALALPEDQIIVTSTRTGEGVAELREAIGALISKATE